MINSKKRKEYQKNWKKENQEKVKNYQKKWRDKNKEKIKQNYKLNEHKYIFKKKLSDSLYFKNNYYEKRKHICRTICPKCNLIGAKIKCIRINKKTKHEREYYIFSHRMPNDEKKFSHMCYFADEI